MIGAVPEHIRRNRFHMGIYSSAQEVRTRTTYTKQHDGIAAPQDWIQVLPKCPRAADTFLNITAYLTPALTLLDELSDAFGSNPFARLHI